MYTLNMGDYACNNLFIMLCLADGGGGGGGGGENRVRCISVGKPQLALIIVTIQTNN